MLVTPMVVGGLKATFRSFVSFGLIGVVTLLMVKLAPPMAVPNLCR